MGKLFFCLALRSVAAALLLLPCHAEKGKGEKGKNPLLPPNYHWKRQRERGRGEREGEISLSSQN